MDIWHWWLAELAVASILYVFTVIWGMRALNRFARARVFRRNVAVTTPVPMAPARFQKS